MAHKPRRAETEDIAVATTKLKNQPPLRKFGQLTLFLDDLTEKGPLVSLCVHVHPETLGCPYKQ